MIAGGIKGGEKQGDGEKKDEHLGNLDQVVEQHVVKMELMLVQLIQLTDQIGRDEKNKKPGYAVGKRDQQLAQQITIKEAHRFAHRNETFRPMAMRNPRKVARNIF